MSVDVLAASVTRATCSVCGAPAEGMCSDCLKAEVKQTCSDCGSSLAIGKPCVTCMEKSQEHLRGCETDTSKNFIHTGTSDDSGIVTPAAELSRPSTPAKRSTSSSLGNHPSEKCEDDGIGLEIDDNPGAGIVFVPSPMVQSVPAHAVLAQPVAMMVTDEGVMEPEENKEKLLQERTERKKADAQEAEIANVFSRVIEEVSIGSRDLESLDHLNSSAVSGGFGKASGGVNLILAALVAALWYVYRHKWLKTAWMEKILAVEVEETEIEGKKVFVGYKRHINPWYRRFKTMNVAGQTISQFLLGGEIGAVFFASLIPLPIHSPALKQMIADIVAPLVGLVFGIVAVCLFPGQMRKNISNKFSKWSFRWGKDGWGKYTKSGIVFGTNLGAMIGGIVGLCSPIPGGMLAGVAIGTFMGGAIGFVATALAVPISNKISVWKQNRKSAKIVLKQGELAVRDDYVLCLQSSLKPLDEVGKNKIYVNVQDGVIQYKLKTPNGVVLNAEITQKELGKPVPSSSEELKFIFKEILAVTLAREHTEAAGGKLASLNDFRTNYYRAGIMLGGGAGAAIGAILGTFVFPGIGSFAGFALGSAVGAVVGGLAFGLAGMRISKHVDPEKNAANSWDYGIRTGVMLGNDYGVASIAKAVSKKYGYMIGGLATFVSATVAGVYTVYRSIKAKGCDLVLVKGDLGKVKKESGKLYIKIKDEASLQYTSTKAGRIATVHIDELEDAIYHQARTAKDYVHGQYLKAVFKYLRDVVPKSRESDITLKKEDLKGFEKGTFSGFKKGILAVTSSKKHTERRQEEQDKTLPWTQTASNGAAWGSMLGGLLGLVSKPIGGIAKGVSGIVGYFLGLGAVRRKCGQIFTFMKKKGSISETTKPSTNIVEGASQTGMLVVLTASSPVAPVPAGAVDPSQSLRGEQGVRPLARALSCSGSWNLQQRPVDESADAAARSRSGSCPPSPFVSSVI